LRETFIDEALGLARRASAGLSQFLEKLAVEDRPVPSFLHRSLQDVVEGYVELTAEVSEPDSELSVILERWSDVIRRLKTDGSLRQRVRTRPMQRRAAESAGPTASVASMIDPRHVRARVLALSTDPRSSEIILLRTRANGEDAVLVRVPAFKGKFDPEISQRLMARLIDRRSGDAHSFAPLNLPSACRKPARNNPPFFECTMPLRGSTMEDLRAEIYDVRFDADFAREGSEEELQKVRRAVLFLREWRALVALAQVHFGPIAPGRRVDEIVKLLRSSSQDTRLEQPLFEAGPSIADLNRLATQSDANLLRYFRDRTTGPGDALLGMARGPAKPLLAELAAAYQVNEVLVK
jgi:hypothetical protein